MKVDIEWIKFLRNELHKINIVDLSSITFLENGIPIEIKKEIIEEFKFAGLNNTTFIEMELYKKALVSG